MAVGPIIRARRATISSALAIWRAYTTRIQLATVILYHSVVASQTGMAESFTTAHWEGVDFSYGTIDRRTLRKFITATRSLGSRMDARSEVWKSKLSHDAYMGA
jgi:hypothetical protein